jgi:hypothetical protein
MDYGTDTSIFANGYPDQGTTAGRRVSSRPAMDLTLSEIRGVDVLLQDLYKMLTTPPEYVFWSRDEQGQPKPITMCLPDLLNDSVDDATLSRVAGEATAFILDDGRFADAEVKIEADGDGCLASVIALPVGTDQPIEVVIRVSGSTVTLVRSGLA